MQRTFVMTMAALMLLAFPAAEFTPTAYADQGDSMRSERGKGKRGHRGGKGHWRRMAKQLDLTQEQEEKIRAIRKERRDAIKSKREAMKAARNKLRQAMTTDASESQLRNLHNDVLNSRQDFAKTRFDQVLAIRAVLTSDQRKKFAEMENRGGKRRWRGKGNRHRGGTDDGE